MKEIDEFIGEVLHKLRSGLVQEADDALAAMAAQRRAEAAAVTPPPPPPARQPLSILYDIAQFVCSKLGAPAELEKLIAELFEVL